MAKFAVISTGGKQYKVSQGDKIRVEKLNVEAGEKMNFDKVLLVAEGESVEVGTPHVSGAKVEAKVLKNSRDRKKIVFRYHAKTRYRKKKGHRQDYSEVEIVKV